MDLAAVAELEGRLRAVCSALDPASVPLPEVPQRFRQLDHITRLANGAKLRLLRRLDSAAPGPTDGLRTYGDHEGAWNLHVRHLPEIGAEIETLLAPFAHRRFEAGRQAGEHEAQAAYRADALLDLARATRDGERVPTGARRADTKVFVHVDAQTLQAGATRPGSTCSVDGVGPVDVAWVRSLLGEAFVAVLLEDAVDVRSVIHLGRQVTAHQRTALEARGHRCEVPGCSVTHGSRSTTSPAGRSPARRCSTTCCGCATTTTTRRPIGATR